MIKKIVKFKSKKIIRLFYISIVSNKKQINPSFYKIYVLYVLFYIRYGF